MPLSCYAFPFQSAVNLWSQSDSNCLVKRYAGVDALKGIDLHVQEGDLFGFIGPNRAGKTTTIRILTTLLEPTAGEAFVDGLSVWKNKAKIRALLGYMPDSFFGVYRDMTVSEYLHFFAAAYGIKSKQQKSLVGGLLGVNGPDLQRTCLGRHALARNAAAVGTGENVGP